MLEMSFVAIDVVQKELLLIASIMFVIGSVDDLIFDCLWIGYALKRKLFVYSKHQRMFAELLPPSKSDDLMAIFVPTWREAPVIGAMLKRCLAQWGAQKFRIYVGCYPNDDQTVAAVTSAIEGSENVRLIICHRNGPTTKADCLNRLWTALCQDELTENIKFKAVVLHDAEDLVHAKALSVFEHLAERATLIQIPVIPRRAVKSRWIAGHYCDEFAEQHGKQMVLREALGVAIPSAGVGCAFSKDALGRLSMESGGKPFDATSLTEDYELGLNLTEGDGRGIFVRLKDQDGQLVATQEFFPDNIQDAVRQKSRWMAGIALSGWDRLGWNHSLRENWIRFRDRKASLAAIVLAIAYGAVFLTFGLEITKFIGIYSPEPISDFLKKLLYLNAFFLSWRLLFKAGFVFHLYGFTEALYSVPRTIVANIINMMAARRAVGKYLQSLSGAKVDWDKTQHFVLEKSEVSELKSAKSGASSD
ncbi:MAG: glycosyl transferase family protein [Parasphingorhabdus sp.]